MKILTTFSLLATLVLALTGCSKDADTQGAAVASDQARVLEELLSPESTERERQAFLAQVQTAQQAVRTSTVAAVVSDIASGSPVADCELNLIFVRQEQAPSRPGVIPPPRESVMAPQTGTRSDGEGRALLEYRASTAEVSVADYEWIGVETFKPGYVRARVHWPASRGLEQALEVPLLPGTTWSGQVLDPDQAPAPGAKVTVTWEARYQGALFQGGFLMFNPSTRSMPKSSHQAYTDAEGRWRMEGAPDFAAVPGLEACVRFQIQWTPGSPPGEPDPGAMRRSSYTPPGEPAVPRPDYQNMRSRHFKVTFNSATPPEAILDLAAGRHVYRLQDYTVTGQVVGPDGEPWPGVAVGARRPEPAMTGPDGRFRITVPRSGTSRVFQPKLGQLADPEHPPQLHLSLSRTNATAFLTNIVLTNWVTEVRLAMSPGITLRGRVIDQDGRPVAEARVTGGGSGAVTGADGSFEMNGFSAEGADVQVWKQGILRPAPIAVAPTDEPVELKIQTEVRFGGRVVRSTDQQPVVGAIVVRVVSERSSGGADPNEEEPSSPYDDPNTVQQTDLDGRFAFRITDVAQFPVIIMAPGYSTRTIESMDALANETGVVLELDLREGPLGRLLDLEGNPIPRAIIQYAVQGAEWGDIAYGFGEKVSEGIPPFAVRLTDAEGRFDLAPELFDRERGSLLEFLDSGQLEQEWILTRHYFPTNSSEWTLVPLLPHTNVVVIARSGTGSVESALPVLLKTRELQLQALGSLEVIVEPGNPEADDYLPDSSVLARVRIKRITERRVGLEGSESQVDSFEKALERAEPGRYRAEGVPPGWYNLYVTPPPPFANVRVTPREVFIAPGELTTVNTVEAGAASAGTAIKVVGQLKIENPGWPFAWGAPDPLSEPARLEKFELRPAKTEKGDDQDGNHGGGIQPQVLTEGRFEFQVPKPGAYLLVALVTKKELAPLADHPRLRRLVEGRVQGPGGMPMPMSLRAELGPLPCHATFRADGWVRREHAHWGIPLGILDMAVEVPAGPGPVDLGEVALPLKPLYRAGTPAPDLVARELNGQEFRLSDCRGSWVVLLFTDRYGLYPFQDEAVLRAIPSWGTADRPLIPVIVNLFELGKGESQWLRQLPGWRFVDLQGLEHPAIQDYRISGTPCAYLIDPEGKLQGWHLRSMNLISALDRQLGEPAGR